MSTDEWDAQQRICIWCIAKKDPDSGRIIPPNHDLCIGRYELRYCECLCPWFRAEAQRWRAEITQTHSRPVTWRQDHP